jgi:hypothetical protein
MKPSILAPSLLLTLLILDGCGKKVSGPSNEATSRVTSGDLSGASAGSDTAKKLDQIDADLRGLLDEERSAREAADRNLQKQIDEIIADLENLASRLDADIATLKAEDEALRKLIKDGLADLKDDLIAAMQAGDENIFQILSEMLRSLENKTNAQQSEIDLIKKVLEALLIKDPPAGGAQYYTLEELAAERKIDVDELKQAKDLAEIQRAILLTRITDLEKRQADFEISANATFATKVELDALRSRVTGLETTVAILNGKVTDLDTRISTEIAALRNELLAKIALVEATANGIRVDFNNHMDLYHKDYEQLGTSVADAINKFRVDLNIVKTDVASIQSTVANLNQRVAELEVFRNMIGNFEAKLEQLKSAAVDEAARAAALEAEEKLAIMKQQMMEEDARLRGQIDRLVTEIESVRQIANSAKALALANQSAISNLDKALDDAKKDFGAQLASLRGDMETKLEAVRKEAADAVASLDQDMQAKFAEANVKLAELTNSVTYGGQTIMHILADVISDITKHTSYNALFQESSKNAANAIFDARTAQARMEDEFIAAIDPVLNSKGVDNNALNTSFRALMSGSSPVCSGQPGIGGAFAAIRNKEWFFHLAREYSRLLVAQARSGAAYEDMFFGRGRIYTNDQNMRSVILIGSTEAYAMGAGGNCAIAVQNWARRILTEDSVHSPKIRAALIAHQAMRASVTELYVKAGNGYNTALEAVVVHVRNLLRDEHGSMASGDLVLFSQEGDAPSKFVQIAQLLMEMSGDVSQINEIRENRENIINLAREVANLKDKTNQNTVAIADLNSRLSTLENRLQQVLAVLPAQVDRLTDAAKISFNLIATIAARLGYNDVVAAADAATRILGGSISVLPERVDGCYAAQHYYNHITNHNLPGTRCESDLTNTGSQLSSSALTKCSIHGAWGAHVAYTWGNLGYVNNGWNAQGQVSSDGHAVQNGLLIRQLEPTDALAKQLAALPKGATSSEQNGQSAFVLRVFGGSPSSFKVSVRSMSNANWHPYDVTVNASEFLISRNGANSNWIYDIPLNKAVGILGSCRWDRQIRIAAVNAEGAEVGPVCQHNFHTFSPIVLDLSGTGKIDTVNPILSSTMFDLDGNGRLERTGWITSGSALLAIDLDGNGKIDSGRELFGEATRLPDGSTAKNGYEALAQYDIDGDGKITLADPVFSKLIVWQDANQDGIAQAWEKFSLMDLGITALSVKFSNVPSEQVVQDHGLPEGNLVKFESRFWGPEKCGKKGCKSFDVFFGSTESYSLSQK